MDIDEIKALTVDQKVGYKQSPSSPVLSATVLLNGPRTDPDGNVVVGLNDLLMIQIDGSTGTINWEIYEGLESIPQLTTLEAQQAV